VDGSIGGAQRSRHSPNLCKWWGPKNHQEWPKDKRKRYKSFREGKENDKRFDKGWQVQVLFVNALGN
jgi:hypothetical protein